MGQSGYANTIINLMLGWIRQLASSVANLFQSPSGMQSGGSALVYWIGANWLKLLIVLIVLGVLIDWIVWMLRWRPYWLWFRKRRVLLDDDIDEVLTDDELMDRYAGDGGADNYAPRFRSEALSRDDDYDDEFDGGLSDYDFSDEDDARYEDEDEADHWDADPYDGYGEPDDDGYDEPDDEGYDEFDDDGYDEPEVEEFDDGYDAPADGEYDGEYADDSDADDGYDDPAFDAGDVDDGYDDADPEWDDVPKRKRKPLRLFGHRFGRRAADEDPFDVDEAEFGDLDDDFYTEVSKKPRYGTDDMRIYARPTPFELGDAEDEIDDSGDIADDPGDSGDFDALPEPAGENDAADIDARTGYRPGEDPSGAPPRRRERRHRAE